MGNRWCRCAQPPATGFHTSGMGGPGGGRRPRTGSTGAAAGTTTPGTAGPRTATGTRRRTATTTWGSAQPSLIQGARMVSRQKSDQTGPIVRPVPEPQGSGQSREKSPGGSGRTGGGSHVRRPRRGSFGNSPGAFPFLNWTASCERRATLVASRGHGVRRQHRLHQLPAGG